MPARTFLKPQLMRFDFDEVSDHNRSELSVDYERIETAERMVDGTMRKNVVATKKSFSVSWDDLPHSSEYTVDGFWGARELQDFYETQVGPFWLNLTEGDGTLSSYFVFVDEFSASLKKRGAYDFWDVEMKLVEA